MKVYGGVEVQIHVFLTSILVEGVINFTSLRLYTQEKEPPVSIG
jgi:hypothetical protein